MAAVSTIWEHGLPSQCWSVWSTTFSTRWVGNRQFSFRLRSVKSHKLALTFNGPCFESRLRLPFLFSSHHLWKLKDICFLSVNLLELSSQLDFLVVRNSLTKRLQCICLNSIAALCLEGQRFKTLWLPSWQFLLCTVMNQSFVGCLILTILISKLLKHRINLTDNHNGNIVLICS